jgi:uncharacterized phiE125 gp8 family phage protein
MSAPAIPPGVAAEAVAECKAYLRIALGDEDADLARFAATALAMGEAFLGCALIVRGHEAVLPALAVWQRLAVGPVRSIAPVRGLPAEGSAFDLMVGDYAIDIDAAGDGWVRVNRPGAAGRVIVAFEAGLASGWAGLPEPIRHGAVRLVAHLHGERDGSMAAPPAAVTALWRPYRRLRVAVQERVS